MSDQRSQALERKPDLREKLLVFGEDYLSDSELLALVLGTGTRNERVEELASRLMREKGGLQGLSRLDVHALAMEKGVGKAKAARIAGVFALAKRLGRRRLPGKISIGHPKDVYSLVSGNLENSSQERFVVICLDAKNKVLRLQEVSVGSARTAIVNPSDVFAPALVSRAVSIIVSHNHPSGDPSPSREDICLTERLRQAGELLGIELLDHVIIGHKCFVSLAQKGHNVQRI